jgi:gas vesicle protein
MQISSTTNSSFLSTTSDLAMQGTTTSQTYVDIVKSLIGDTTYQTRDDVNASDGELEQFRKSLSTKGAAVFLADQNQEKIEALVEKYRQKLLDEQAKNPDKTMNIAKMVSDYKEQLMKELEKAQEAEKSKTALPAETILKEKVVKATPITSSEGNLQQLLSIQTSESKKEFGLFE